MNNLRDKLKSWLESTRPENKNNVLVLSKPEFREAVKIIEDLKIDKEKLCYISIESTPECAKYWMEEEKEDFDNDHILESSDKVLNLNFDDINSDREYKGHLFKTISEEQAKQIVDFIDNNMGKDIIIHCKAGSSRSQAIYRFIIDNYTDYYTPFILNKDNPCITPNIEVLSKLNKIYRYGRR
jgi:hypothetical protein